jgi:hypothetical protein
VHFTQRERDEADRQKQARKRLKYNAAQIQKYIEHRDPITNKGTAGSCFNLEVVQQSNPESEAPMSERGHKWHSDIEGDNQDFYNKIIPLFLKYEGTYMGVPARILQDKPHLIAAWEDGKTEHHRDMYKRLTVFCMFLAKKLEQRCGPVLIRCHIHPKLERQPSGPRGAQKYDTRYSDWVITQKLAKIQREEGPMKQKAAWGLLSDREDYSPRRIRSAIEAVNRKAREEAS